MISIGTPKGFVDEIHAAEVAVLPLVANRDREWRAGWCTHAMDFAKFPDVEFLCGGVNHQTPTSAALWRQGNLLHFGFEQSPAEMNESGQRLLLNSIAYISRFSEDRPIAVTPSVFAGPVASPRIRPARRLRAVDMPIESLKNFVEPKLWETISSKGDRQAMAKWAESNQKFFHPALSQKLEIDEDSGRVRGGIRRTGVLREDDRGPAIGQRGANREGMASAETLRSRWSECRNGRGVGCLVGGESVVRLCLRRRRLSVVH